MNRLNILYLFCSALIGSDSDELKKIFIIDPKKIKREAFFIFPKDNIFKLFTSASMIGISGLGDLFLRSNLKNDIILNKKNISMFLGASFLLALGVFKTCKDYNFYKMILLHSELSYNLTQIIISPPVKCYANSNSVEEMAVSEYKTEEKIRDIANNINIFS
jgi:hypothetical protein